MSKKKFDKSEIIIKICAIVFAILMVLSMASTCIYYIINNMK